MTYVQHRMRYSTILIPIWKHFQFSCRLTATTSTSSSPVPASTVIASPVVAGTEVSSAVVAIRVAASPVVASVVIGSRSHLERLLAALIVEVAV